MNVTPAPIQLTQQSMLQSLKAQTLAQAPAPQADLERQRKMREAWKAYRGEFQRPLKIRENQPDDNVISNRCEPIVNKGVSFLFGQILKLEAPVGDEAIQTFIDGLWGDDDDKMTLLSLAATNGGICGQAFFKLVPPQGQMKYPRIVVIDPMLVRIVTAPDDVSLILAFIIEYPIANDLQMRQIIACIDPDGLSLLTGDYDRDDYWTITNYVRKGMAGDWSQVGEQVVWDYPFPPLFTCQNLPNPNEPWGTPDLTPDLIEMNKVLNFVQSNTSRIIKFHGHPKTYATGIRTSQIDIGVDEMIVFESPDARLNNLEMHANLADQLNFANILRSDMDEQSRVPAVALGRQSALPTGNISGVALSLMFQPLIEKTTIKRRTYGKVIREITRAALVLAGLLSLDEYEDYPIELHWQNLLPVDNLAAAQTALILQQIGVSSATILQQLGYNPDDEADKTAAEAARTQTQYARGQGMPPDTKTILQQPAEQKALEHKVGE